MSAIGKPPPDGPSAAWSASASRSRWRSPEYRIFGGNTPGLSRRDGGLESHGVAEALQPSDGPALDGLPIALLEIGHAEIFNRRLAREAAPRSRTVPARSPVRPAGSPPRG